MFIYEYWLNRPINHGTVLGLNLPCADYVHLVHDISLPDSTIKLIHNIYGANEQAYLRKLVDVNKCLNASGRSAS